MKTTTQVTTAPAPLASMSDADLEAVCGGEVEPIDPEIIGNDEYWDNLVGWVYW